MEDSVKTKSPIERVYDSMLEHYSMDMDYNTFKDGLADEKKRRQVYDAMTKFYNMGTFESFSEKMHPTAVEHTQPVTADEVQRPSSKPQPDLSNVKYPIAPNRAGLDTSMQFQPAESPSQYVSPAQENEQRAAVQASGEALSPEEAEQMKAELAAGQRGVQKAMQPFQSPTLDKTGHERDFNAIAESVWNAAEERTRAAQEEAAAKTFEEYQSVPAAPENRFMRGGELALGSKAAYLSNHDLEQMSAEAWDSLGKEGQADTIRDIFAKLREKYPYHDVKQLYDVAKATARSQSDQSLYDLAVKKNMPSNVLEFFARKVAGANMLSKLTDAMARQKAGTSGDMLAKDVAEQQYGKEHRIADIAGTVVGMGLDPTTWIAGALGKGVAGLGKLAINKLAVSPSLGGKILRGIGLYNADTLGGRILLGSLASSANLGTFMSGQEALDQLRLGGKVGEDGKIGDYDLGAIGDSGLRGAGLGLATGVAAPLIGNVSDKLVNATGSTAGKVAIKAAELGASTVAEATIFSLPEWISGEGDPFDVWTDNLALMAGFKLNHAIKSAPARLSELAKNPESKAGFETRLRKMLDGNPSYALTADEKAELKERGYSDLSELARDYKAGEKAADGPVPYGRFAELMNDGNVSEAARAKMYYYITGKRIPMSTVMGSDVVDNGNGKYTVRSMGANGVITSRTFNSIRRAKTEVEKINRQAELNSVDVGERYARYKDGKERMMAACDAIGKRHGTSGDVIYSLLNMEPSDMSAGQKELAKRAEREIKTELGKIEMGDSAAEMRRAVNEKYGVDVDKAVAKEPNRRTDAERDAIKEYARNLFDVIEAGENAPAEPASQPEYQRQLPEGPQPEPEAVPEQPVEPIVNPLKAGDKTIPADMGGTPPPPAPPAAPAPKYADPNKQAFYERFGDVVNENPIATERHGTIDPMQVIPVYHKDEKGNSELAGFLRDKSSNGSIRMIYRVDAVNNTITPVETTEGEWGDGNGQYKESSPVPESAFYKDYMSVLNSNETLGQQVSDEERKQMVADNVNAANQATELAKQQLLNKATPEERDELAKEMSDEDFIKSVTDEKHRDKKGNLDFNTFTPAELFRYSAIEYGLDTAVEDAQYTASELQKEAEALNAKIATVAGPERVALRAQIKELTTRIDAYNDILQQYQQEVAPVNAAAEAKVEAPAEAPVAEAPVQTPEPVAAPVAEPQPAPAPAVEAAPAPAPAPEEEKPTEAKLKRSAKKPEKPVKTEPTLTALTKKGGSKTAHNNAAAKVAENGPVDNADAILEDFKSGDNARKAEAKKKLFAFASTLDADSAKEELAKAQEAVKNAAFESPERIMNKHLVKALERRIKDLESEAKPAAKPAETPAKPTAKKAGEAKRETKPKQEPAKSPAPVSETGSTEAPAPAEAPKEAKEAKKEGKRAYRSTKKGKTFEKANASEAIDSILAKIKDGALPRNAVKSKFHSAKYRSLETRVDMINDVNRRIKELEKTAGNSDAVNQLLEIRAAISNTIKNAELNNTTKTEAPVEVAGADKANAIIKKGEQLIERLNDKKHQGKILNDEEYKEVYENIIDAENASSAITKKKGTASDVNALLERFDDISALKRFAAFYRGATGVKTAELLSTDPKLLAKYNKYMSSRAKQMKMTKAAAKAAEKDANAIRRQNPDVQEGMYELKDKLKDFSHYTDEVADIESNIAYLKKEKAKDAKKPAGRTPEEIEEDQREYQLDIDDAEAELKEAKEQLDAARENLQGVYDYYKGVKGISEKRLEKVRKALGGELDADALAEAAEEARHEDRAELMEQRATPEARADRKQVHRLADQLSKILDGTGIEVRVVPEDVFNEILKLQQKDASLYDETANGMIAIPGFLSPDGVVYINEDGAMIDTPIHEIGIHAVSRIAKKYGYKPLIGAIQRYGEMAPEEFKDKVRQLYPGLEERSKKKFNEEVAAYAFGQHFSGKQREFADRTIWQKLIDAIKKFFKDCKDVLVGHRKLSDIVGNRADLSAFSAVEKMGYDDLGQSLYNLAMGGRALAAAIEKELNGKQKNPSGNYPTTLEPAMYQMTKNVRGTVEAWLKKRTDISDEERQRVLDYLDTLNNSKLQLATAKWFTQGKIRIPEDMDKVEQAISVAEKAKVDPLQYDNPMALIDAHANFKPAEKRINPDDVPTLHRVKEYPKYGVVVYDVDDSDESRENMREIINTHYGKDANPWCVLKGDGDGNLTYDSYSYWLDYDAYPKQVAFKDGKLLAFSANDEETPLWWDRQDVSHYGIPIGSIPIDGDELGRNATFEIKNGRLVMDATSPITKGNKQNGEYTEWWPDGRIKFTANFKNGVPDGHVVEYYDNGIVAGSVNYKDGEKDGDAEYFYPEGGLRSVYHFKNGVIQGKETYHSNGGIHERIPYVDGIREGVVESFYPSGALEGRVEMKNDYPNGKFEAFHKNGNLHQSGEYFLGKKNGKFRKYFDDGTLIQEYNYVRGEKDGPQYDYYGDGTVMNKAVYEDGTVREEYHYSNNGTLLNYTPYDKFGRRDGVEKTWNYDGELVSAIEYNKGDEVDDVTEEERAKEHNTEKVDELSGLYSEISENGINDVSLQKIKDYAKRVQEGKSEYLRWSDRRLSESLHGPVSTRALEASVIGGRNDSSNSADSPVQITDAEKSGAAVSQERDLETWARSKGIWIDNTSEALTDRYGEPIRVDGEKPGSEAEVYKDEENGRVLKEINTIYFGTPVLLLDRIHIHNSFFPNTSLQIEAIGRNANGEFVIVCSQPFVEGEEPTQEEIDSYVENELGLKRTLHTGANEFGDEYIVLSDLHTGNVIKGKNGKLYFIDIDGRLNTPRLKLGGTYEIPDYSNGKNGAVRESNGLINPIEDADDEIMYQKVEVGAVTPKQAQQAKSVEEQFNAVFDVAKTQVNSLTPAQWLELFKAAGVKDKLLNSMLSGRNPVSRISPDAIIDWADNRYWAENPVNATIDADYTGGKVGAVINDIIRYTKDNIIGYSAIRRRVLAAGGVISGDDYADSYTSRLERGNTGLQKYEDEYMKPLDNAVAAIISWAKANGKSIDAERVGYYLLALNAPARNKWITVDKALTHVKEELGVEKLELLTDEDVALMYNEICLGKADPKELYKDFPKEYQIAADYLYEHKDVNARNQSGSNDKISLDDEGAAKYVSEFNEAVPENLRKDLTEAMHNASQEILRLSVYYGFHDQAFVDKCNERYPNYAPFVDWEDEEERDKIVSFDGAGFRSDFKAKKSSLNPNIRKAAKGRSTISANPVGMILFKAANTIFSGEENRSRQLLYQMIEENRNLSNLFYSEHVDKDGNLVKVSEMPEWLHGVGKDGRGAHAVRVYVGGHEVSMFFAGQPGKDLHNGIEEVSKLTKFLRKHDTDSSIGAIGRGALRGAYNLNMKAIGFLSQMMTTYNPAFPPINAVRDVRYAWRQTFNTQGAKAAAKFLKGVVPSMRECWKNMLGRPSERFQQYLEDGGYIGYSRLGDPQRYAKQVEREIQNAIKGRGSKVTRTRLGHALHCWAEMFENVARFDAYSQAIDAGMSRTKAAAMAHEVSTNLSRRGNQKLLSAWTLFFNANLEGAAQQFRNIYNKDTRKRAIAMHFMQFGMGILQAVMARALAAALWDDDDDRSYWEKVFAKDNPINLIADYAKKGVFIIPFMNVGKKLFGKDMFDKDNTGDIFGMVFHSPFMYRFDEYAAEHLMKTITGAEDGSEFVSAVVNGFVDEYNPFAGTALTEERGSSKESVWKVFSMPLHVPVPSLIRPIEDVRRNISSLGMPIHNEPRKGSADETRPRFMQAKPGTNPVMKNISRALNWISLGDSVDAGFLNIAPEDIEYILSSTLGTWWNIFDFATEKLFSPKGEMARYGKKLPVAGRFYYRGGSSLYDRVEDLKEEYDKAIPFEKRGKDTMGEGEFAEKEGHMDEIIERGANPAIDMYKEYKSQINELEEAYRTAIKVARNRRNSPEERKAASEEAEAALQGIRDLNYETGRAWEKSKETMNQ